MSIRKSVVLFAFAAILAGPVLAFAQTTASVGIKGGVNLSTVSSDETTEFERRLGLTGGVFAGLKLSETVGVQIEALLSQRGAKISDSEGDLDIRFDYIDVPVLFRVGPAATNDLHFHVFAGPTLSYRANAKVSFGDEDLTAESEIKENTKKYDLGVTVGASVELSKLIFDARYTHGLINIDDSPDDEKLKHRSFSFTIGFRFN